jgi:hypothetical protein
LKIGSIGSKKKKKKKKRVSGSELMVQGSGFKVQGLGG